MLQLYVKQNLQFVNNRGMSFRERDEIFAKPMPFTFLPIYVCSCLHSYVDDGGVSACYFNSVKGGEDAYKDFIRWYTWPIMQEVGSQVQWVNLPKNGCKCMNNGRPVVTYPNMAYLCVSAIKLVKFRLQCGAQIDISTVQVMAYSLNLYNFCIQASVIC